MFIRAMLVLALAGIGWSCSSDDSGGNTDGSTTADADATGDATETTVVDTTQADVVTNTTGYCLSTNDCATGWCDKRKSGCVQCYLAGHCPDGQACANGLCVESAECDPSTPCAEGVCVDGSCVECASAAECPASWECVDATCRPALDPCEEEEECLGMGGSCSAKTDTCVPCLDESQCAFDEFCLDGECRPDPCTPSSVTCATNSALKICRDDGQGSLIVPCEGDLQCLGGTCTNPECDEPGTVKCLKEQREICTDQGLKVLAPCPLNKECIEGECRDLRQRVLVIFDTSGSMNADPAIQNYPDLCSAGGSQERCIEPWPTCDPSDDPFTVLGVSKKVFSNFFKSDDSSNVFFALQRFPQRAENSAPVCDGGYFRGDTVVQGDNGAHEVPLGVQTWFDTYRDEIVLVPFPPPDSSSNLLALTQWLDFQESLFKTDESCFQVSDCDDGVCLGPTGNKRCHVFTNPELRAHGWTPLGKSLFYAGEYFRRYVVVDGKQCTTDGDCGSPGYLCNEETNKCYDPRKECRLNVIVLFTDGGETQFPFTNEFFNPQVQAKRLRYGLGCTTDTDCSKIDICRPILTEKKCSSNDDCLNNKVCDPTGYCAETTGTKCYPNFCKQGDNGSYCTNAVIEGVDAAGNPLIAAGAKPKIQFRDVVYGADRLRDFNGNPINVVVNVVDASLVDPESVNAGALSNNYQIALNGGGLHVVVSVNDQADFLAKLKATIDPKNLYGQCVAE